MAGEEQETPETDGPEAGAYTGSGRYGLVLLLVICDFTFISATKTTDFTRLWAILFSAAVYIAAVHASGIRGRLQRASHAGAAVVVVVAAALSQILPNNPGHGILSLCTGLLVFLAPVIISRGLVQQIVHEGVDTRTVAGALSVYLMIGIFFAYLVLGVSDISHHQYFSEHSHTDLSEDMYFSFITMATVGYGDFTPALPIGRSFAILEGVTGQLYLVTVVAVLVSNLGPRARVRLERERAAQAAGGQDSPPSSAR